MSDFPDIRNYPSLVKYVDLQTKLTETIEQDEAKQICLEMIALVPIVLKEAEDFNNCRITASRQLNESIGRYETDDYYRPTPFVTAVPFKRYAIICEKEGNLQEAIQICDYALSLGLEKDGTKAGMQGRLEKLKKKAGY